MKKEKEELKIEVRKSQVDWDNTISTRDEAKVALRRKDAQKNKESGPPHME